MKQESDDATFKFQEQLMDLTVTIGQITNDILIKTYQKSLQQAVAKSSKLIIDCFIKTVYYQKIDDEKGQIRDKIIRGEEEFFLNDMFDDMIVDGNKILKDIFAFKKIWKNLSEENKQLIKEYMLMLCYYSDIRYVNFERYRYIRKFNNKNFPKIFETTDAIF